MQRYSAAAPLPCAEREGDSIIRLETELGNIDIRLFGKEAPLTVRNFLRYVQAGAFDGGNFFRTVREDNQRDKPVKIAVIQADVPDQKANKVFPPIPLERSNQTGIRHLDGTLSMARDKPDSATASFSIVVGDQPNMDYGGKRNPDGQGFAAFGRVTHGMDVVRRIQASTAIGELLSPPILIRRAYILK